MLKILAIDDSKAVHAFLNTCFTNAKVTLTHTYNGKEGSDLLATDITAFDLILLDWEMPVMDGPTTLDTLRKLGVKAPVLMMTTRNAPQDIMLMIGKGASDFVLKPFTADLLQHKIEETLGKGLSDVA